MIDREAAIRDGAWMQTSTGLRFFPQDPQPEDFCIEDIAHGLSNICRFGGHTRDFYSVAQHSVLVSRLVPEEFRLTALLHDATEAYLGDMVRPLKRILPGFRKVEEAWASAATTALERCPS